MPKEYNWVIQYAARDKKRGRGVEGMITGMKKNQDEEEIQKKTQGIINYSVEINGEKWKIISIYNKEEKKKTLEELEEIIEGKGWKKMIVEGDFNARTAETGTDRTCMGRRRGKRYSKDKIMNKQGIDLLEKIEKMGLDLLNGNKEGDDQGEWTGFTGAKGSSVIDYAICNAETWEEIKSFRRKD